jgi:hypothetical protein
VDWSGPPSTVADAAEAAGRECSEMLQNMLPTLTAVAMLPVLAGSEPTLGPQDPSDDAALVAEARRNRLDAIERFVTTIEGALCANQDDGGSVTLAIDVRADATPVPFTARSIREGIDTMDDARATYDDLPGGGTIAVISEVQGDDPCPIALGVNGRRAGIAVAATETEARALVRDIVT